MAKEIDYLSDFDWDLGTYYEVELWRKGDYDSHFFRTKKEALSYFEEHVGSNFDCVKWHHEGNCQIIKDKVIY